MQIPPYALKLIIFLVIFIVGVSIFQFFFLVHPVKIKTKAHPKDFGMDYEDVSFRTGDGLELKGWFMPSGYSNATIIVCHGYPADKNNLLMASGFLLKHYNLLLFDFRYFGESEGKYTTGGYREQEDIRAAVRYLKSRKDVDRIGAMGFSLGASALLMSHPDDIEAIVADSPYASMEMMVKEVYWMFPWFTKIPFVWINRVLGKMLFGADIKDASAAEEMKSIKSPVLLIHGGNDRQIPVSHSRLLYEESDMKRTELWIVAGAHHGMAQAIAGGTYRDRILAFFDKHLLKE